MGLDKALPSPQLPRAHEEHPEPVRGAPDPAIQSDSCLGDLRGGNLGEKGQYGKWDRTESLPSSASPRGRAPISAWIAATEVPLGELLPSAQISIKDGTEIGIDAHPFIHGGIGEDKGFEEGVRISVIIVHTQGPIMHDVCVGGRSPSLLTTRELDGPLIPSAPECLIDDKGERRGEEACIFLPQESATDHLIRARRADLGFVGLEINTWMEGRLS
jgi:hypothetical protein